MTQDATAKPTTSLVRQLGLISAIFICMSNEIGSGVFLVGSDIAGSVPEPIMGLLVWLIAGLITLTGALIFAELGTMFPDAGGQYVFLREAFHPIVSFLFGWTLIMVIQTGSIAGVAVAFSKFSNPFFPMLVDSNPDAHGALTIWGNLAASGIIVALTLLNFLGIKRGAKILDGITWVKIIAIIGIILFVMTSSPSLSASPIVMQVGSGFTFAAFGVALLAAFWGYDGWYSITFVAGEMKNPARDIPLASLVAIVGTATLYMLCSYCYFHVLTHDQIVKSSFLAADAIRVVAGDLGVKVLGIIVIISVIGCINAMIISGARVAYAMAKDNVLPPWLAVVNPKTHSPNRSLVMQMVWSIALVWSGKYDDLFTYVIFGAFMFYGLTAVGLFRLRRTKPNHPRPYKVPLYPILPAAYVLFTICLTINTLREKTSDSLKGLVIILIGLPVYWLMKKYVIKPRV